LPVYNEIAILQTVIDKYIADLDAATKNYEIIAVNDGCTDGSEDVLAYNAKLNRNLRVVNLDGRFGKQAAINAGMDMADKTSEIVMLADIDILNPVGSLGRVIGEFENGENIVYARRENLGFNSIKADFSDLSVAIGAKLFGVAGRYNGKVNIAAFRQPVVDVIRALPNRNKYLRSMDTWLGWNVHFINYSSGYSLKEEKKLVNAEFAEEFLKSASLKGAGAIPPKPPTRDRMREHTRSNDAMWAMLAAGFVMLLTGIFYAGMGGGVAWMHLVIWLSATFLLLLGVVFYFQSVLIKRIGLIYGKNSVAYDIKSVINFGMPKTTTTVAAIKTKAKAKVKTKKEK